MKKTGHSGRKAILAVIVAIVVSLAGTLGAIASDKVRCEFLTIEASNSNKGIDPKLKSYAGIFKQAPFSQFNSFKLVEKQSYEMLLNVPVALTLPSSLGGSLRLDRKDGEKLELTLTLIRAGRSPIQIKGRASPGSPFFAAGLKNPNGVWVFGVACNRDEIIVH